MQRRLAHHLLCWSKWLCGRTSRWQPQSLPARWQSRARSVRTRAPLPASSGLGTCHARRARAARGSYKFQNALDMALVASSLALILLGGVYTFATGVKSQQRNAVEVVMLSSMILAVILAIAYLAWVWRVTNWDMIAGAASGAAQELTRAKSFAAVRLHVPSPRIAASQRSLRSARSDEAPGQGDPGERTRSLMAKARLKAGFCASLFSLAAGGADMSQAFGDRADEPSSQPCATEEAETPRRRRRQRNNGPVLELQRDAWGRVLDDAADGADNALDTAEQLQTLWCEDPQSEAETLRNGDGPHRRHRQRRRRRSDGVAPDNHGVALQDCGSDAQRQGHRRHRHKKRTPAPGPEENDSPGSNGAMPGDSSARVALMYALASGRLKRVPLRPSTEQPTPSGRPSSQVSTNSSNRCDGRLFRVNVNSDRHSAPQQSKAQTYEDMVLQMSTSLSPDEGLRRLSSLDRIACLQDSFTSSSCSLVEGSDSLAQARAAKAAKAERLAARRASLMAADDDLDRKGQKDRPKRVRGCSSVLSPESPRRSPAWPSPDESSPSSLAF